MRRIAIVLAGLGPAAACGSGSDPEPACELDPSFEAGGDGHADPLGAGPGEARAGRVAASDLPPTPGGNEVWAGGDFVLANDRIALVLEDVGPSDLYDPWGGRPVGMAAVEGGELVSPADFGEFLILTGRYSALTQEVSVLSDGSDGEAAVVRASGFLAPIPFFEPITGGLLTDDLYDIPAAIDYVLEPDADHVEVHFNYRSTRTQPADVNAVLHAFLYAPRMTPFTPGLGFNDGAERGPYVALIDDDATSYAYLPADGELSPGVAASGFFSYLTDAFEIPACAEMRRHHASLVLASPGLDPVLEAVAELRGESLRRLEGTVRDPQGAPVAGVRVHAEETDGAYLTRARTDEGGAFALHVPPETDVVLTAFRRGDAVVGPATVAAGEQGVELTLEPAGAVRVTAADADGAPLPVRVQVLPVDGAAPELPSRYGEPAIGPGRARVAYPTDGDVTLRAPAGEWDVYVSRGYEYELFWQRVTVAAGETSEVDATLARVVDTSGALCADFHIHTNRSPDAYDDAALKVRAAVADGLEVPVRSDHEYVADFQPIIEELGLEEWAFGIGSVEMTSMEIWGHMGVLPLDPDPSRINAGTPLWQSYPSAEEPDVELETLNPVDVFARVRERPERPIIIINHPRSSTNYFGFTGFDGETGAVMYPEFWDEEFQVVEVFNGSSWRENRDGTVRDWLTLLDSGRRVFSVGSSDSHGIAWTAVGYPRTCLHLGTDDPGTATAREVADTAYAGRSVVSGGIYLEASVAGAAPGEEASGVGDSATLDLRVQAPPWIDADTIEVVVDGETLTMIPIAPEDADPMNPAIRYQGTVDVPVAADGSYVLVAAYGEEPLDPVTPGERPFGVTNPIFLAR